MDSLLKKIIKGYIFEFIMNNMCYLGVDIGSSFTKFVVIDEGNNIQFKHIVKTLTRDKNEQKAILDDIYSKYNINNTCATGYGRQHFKYSDLTKTELYCSAAGVSALYPIEKTIIDIGGEDVKIVKSGSNGKVLDFYMNTKCAAGTGSFITEIAERAEIDISKMSQLASKSNFNKELNSFCTVFAKTEIMQWIFDEIPIEDTAKGIYISIVNRILKIPMDRTLPLFLIGGVAEFHPFLKNVIEEKINKIITVPVNPQLINAFGAAVLAKTLK